MILEAWSPTDDTESFVAEFSPGARSTRARESGGEESVGEAKAMMPELKGRWTKALRSGLYVRTEQLELRTDRGWCALGVLFDVLREFMPDLVEWRDEPQGWTMPDRKWAWFKWPAPNGASAPRTSFRTGSGITSVSVRSARCTQMTPTTVGGMASCSAITRASRVSRTCISI